MARLNHSVTTQTTPGLRDLRHYFHKSLKSIQRTRHFFALIRLSVTVTRPTNLPTKPSTLMNDKIETITELANRRQYFRVEDKASIEVIARETKQTAAECFELSPEFSLISEFQLLDVESKHLLRTLTDKDKNLGQFLKVMNKKLDSLSRVIALNNQQSSSDTIQSINLSEGGLAFNTHSEYGEGQAVAIKLVLLPSYSGLILEGEVLSCKANNASFEIHIAFSNISEAHQQLIARHIMRVQSQNRDVNPSL